MATFTHTGKLSHHRQSPDSPSAYRLPTGDENKGRSRRRRYCPACSEFTFARGETVCRCGASLRLDAKGQPVYPLLAT